MSENNHTYYKDEIIKLISGIESTSILKYIYSIISSYLKSRGL